MADSNSCRFPPRCRETSYQTSVSSTAWPSQVSWPWILEGYQHRQWPGGLSTPEFFGGESGDFYFDDLAQSNDSRVTQLFAVTKNQLTQSVVKVNVHFSSGNVEVKEEIPKYTTESLVSSLGGALSLYLGVTIISFLEIVEVLVYYVGRKRP